MKNSWERRKRYWVWKRRKGGKGNEKEKRSVKRKSKKNKIER